MTDEMMAAIREHDLPTLRCLVEEGADLEAKSKPTPASHGTEGWTLLTYAAYHGNVPAAEYLLDRGADLDAPTGSAGGMWEWTPLMMAAYRGHEHMARFLLDKGTDVFAENRRAETALSLAWENDHPEVVQMLTEAGASLDTLKHYREQPIEFVIRRTDGDPYDFNLKFDQYPAVMQTSSVPSRTIKGWGSHRIEVAGCEVSFSDEPVGFQVVFETGDISEDDARRLVEEICENIVKATGQPAEVVST